MARPFVLVSNRGPVSFSYANADGTGDLVPKRGAGGLVSGLRPLVAGTDTIWLAAAMSDGDRAAAAQGVLDVEDLRVRLVDVDADTYRAAYDVVCNATLWFAHHGLFDVARRPRLDRRWRSAWDAYRELNAAFASAVAEVAPEGAAVLVQDYHLCLLAPSLRSTRPDLRLVHFAHTPFATPEWLRALPDDAAGELLAGLGAHHACAFHTERWAEAFRRCCATHGVEVPATGVTPLPADVADLDAVATSPACAAAGEALDETFGHRRVILRVDRVELSKNLLRGFDAYDLLLEERPDLRGEVVFGAFVYPSREGLAEYVAYRQEVETAIRRINEKWAEPGWTPIVYDDSDDFPRSVAALQRADVLLVNPVRDGLNLVAKEGVHLGRRDPVLVLSTEAGVWDELGEAGALGVNPFDIVATAEAIASALEMPADERARRAAALRAAVDRRSPADWLDEQLALADRSSSS